MDSGRPQTTPSPAGPVRAWELVTLGALLLVGAGLRAGYLFELRDSPGFANPVIDPRFHDYWARALVTGDWTPPAGESDPHIRTTPYLRPPGYPYFLALVYKVAGLSYLAPRLVQMALGLANGVLAFLLARRWFGRATGLVSAGLVCTYWIFIYFEGQFQEPVLLIFLLLSALALLAKWSERQSFRWALGAGLLLGLAALVKPNPLLFVPLGLVWMVWIVRRRQGTWRASWRALGLVLGAVLAVAPATIRNYVVARDFVPISANGGVNLFMGNNRSADGLFLRWIPGWGTFDTCFAYPAIVERAAADVGHALKYSEVSAYFTHKALDFIWQHPQRFITLTIQRALQFWGPDEISLNEVIDCERSGSTILRSIPGNFALIVALFLLGLLGVVLDTGAAPSGDPSAVAGAARLEISVLLVAFILSFFVSYVFFFNAAVYRAPLIPFLMLFGAYGVSRLGRLAWACQWRRAATGVLAGVGLYVLANIALVPYQSPGPVAWHCYRAKLYDDQGSFARALDETQAALRIEPGSAEANVILATLLRRQGRTEEAATAVRTALSAVPQSANLHCLLGDLLLEQNRVPAAISEYRAALRIDPQQADARRGLESALARPQRK